MKEKIMNVNFSQKQKNDEFNQKVFKDYLVKCLSLLEDLKKINDEEVKVFIFDKLYNLLNLIEVNIYNLFNENANLQKNINLQKRSLSTLQNQLMSMDAMKMQEINQIVESKLENEQDQRLKEEFELSKVNVVESKLPKHEEDFYKNYLNGDLNADENEQDDLEDDIENGNLISDQPPLTLDEILHPCKSTIDNGYTNDKMLTSEEFFDQKKTSKKNKSVKKPKQALKYKKPKIVNNSKKIIKK